jgi:excisionase family DNA binding protein
MAKKTEGRRPDAEEWLSLDQVAEALELPRNTVLRWARDGDPRLPAYRVWDEGAEANGRFRFKKSDVEAFGAPAQAQEVETPAA